MVGPITNPPPAALPAQDVPSATVPLGENTVEKRGAPELNGNDENKSITFGGIRKLYAIPTAGGVPELGIVGISDDIPENALLLKPDSDIRGRFTAELNEGELQVQFGVQDQSANLDKYTVEASFQDEGGVVTENIIGEGLSDAYARPIQALNIRSNQQLSAAVASLAPGTALRPIVV